MRFFATTAKGMEPLLGAELRALGAAAVEETRAGAAFEGELGVGYRACLWSRVANRVLLPLATFDATDGDSLYAGVRAIAWGEHLGPAQTLAVDFASARSKLAHTHFGALKTKDAIVDRLRDETGARPSVDTERPDVRVNVHLHEDRATVSIDLSGDSLHRRGWRDPATAAPLKENLAAALLLLADWPARARDGAPLIDPMCGSGTIVIEAAFIAADIAPGLRRTRWGFVAWRGHQPAVWEALVEEARAREITDGDRLPPIVGYDADPRAVRAALANVERAGLRGRVHVEKRDLAALEPIAARRGSSAPGIVITNPPYGERIAPPPGLYGDLGDLLRRRFPAWTGYVLTGNPALAKEIGLRASRRHVLWNGAIECRLLELPISAEPVTSAPRSRREATFIDPQVVMFANRLRKNLKHLSKWARREGVHCYRVYDADLPEYAVAVDLYERSAHVQEYEAPATVDARKAEERLRAIVAALPEVLEIPAEELFVKVRRRQRGGSQYEKQEGPSALREVREGGHRFLVNLSDYVDTGLFLDERPLRAMIGELAPGRDVLNLFCYTGTATVYAAAARSTTSVDLSNTYLEWAAKNFELNALPKARHALVRADVLEWLPSARRRFGLIFLAPPTFSNSKAMAGDLDLQRDHVALLRATARLLEDDGVLLFSNHFRRFKLDEAALPELAVENISHLTLPPDFARSPRIHNAWRIRRR
jgi:23S rRNA (guanine2445-N2)-methyltransferase / 23S rRNA (guanine2069-N7)-methyltransferase